MEMASTQKTFLTCIFCNQITDSGTALINHMRDYHNILPEAIQHSDGKLQPTQQSSVVARGNNKRSYDEFCDVSPYKKQKPNEVRDDVIMEY